MFKLTRQTKIAIFLGIVISCQLFLVGLTTTQQTTNAQPTSPRRAGVDSDGDGFEDDAEIIGGSDPNSADSIPLYTSNATTLVSYAADTVWEFGNLIREFLGYDVDACIIRESWRFRGTIKAKIGGFNDVPGTKSYISGVDIVVGAMPYSSPYPTALDNSRDLKIKIYFSDGTSTSYTLEAYPVTMTAYVVDYVLGAADLSKIQAGALISYVEYSMYAPEEFGTSVYMECVYPIVLYQYPASIV